MKIVKDKKFLRQVSLDSSLEEAKEIAAHLIETLKQTKETDVALAAPQIGILKRVCYVRVKTPFILVNPEIINNEGITWFQEGCLSFPGASVRTQRYKDVVVKVDHYGEVNGDEIIWYDNKTLYFTPDNVNKADDMGLLESVAVQHEIAHLDGKLMFDFKWKNETIRVNKTYKPNDRVTIENSETGELQENMKYKKIENLLHIGWKIV